MNIDSKFTARWVTFVFAVAICAYSLVSQVMWFPELQVTLDSWFSTYKNPWVYPLAFLYLSGTASFGAIAYLAWSNRRTRWLFLLVVVSFLFGHYYYLMLLVYLSAFWWYLKWPRHGAKLETAESKEPEN